MTGTTVTLHLHWRKRNQHVMNQRLSTSISGKLIPDNLVGEGGENERSEVETGEGLRSVDREKGPSPGSPPLCFGDPPLSHKGRGEEGDHFRRSGGRPTLS
jgi:hypothetical protein